MDISDIRLGLVKYKFKSLQIKLPGVDPFDVDEQYIKSLIIEKDYDNFYFPFFQIEVGLPNYLYRAMKKNNYEIRAYVDLQKALFYDIEPTNSAKGMSSYIQSNFFVFMEDMSPEPLERELEKGEKDNQSFNKGYAYGEMTIVRLLLYREDFLFNSKKLVNVVFSSTTLVNALTYVCNNTGLKDILISPPNNYKSYRELIITPVTVMEQLERLCNEYGMHTNGSTIFFDFKYLYILNKIPKCKAQLPQEIMVTYLASLMSSGPESVQGMGCYTKPNEYYFANIVPDSIQIESQSGFNEQIYGNSFTTIDTASGSVSTVSSGATNTKGASTKSTRTVVRTGADNSTGVIKQTLLESSKVATLGFSYVDLDMFAANKEYVLTLEDVKFKLYNGKYRISRSLAIFENEGLYWIPHVTAEFRA